MTSRESVEESRRRERATSSMPRVLVVGNEPLIRSAMASLFVMRGYEIAAEVEELAQAAPLTATPGIDAVLLDIPMGKREAHQALVQLRQTMGEKTALAARRKRGELLVMPSAQMTELILRQPDGQELVRAMENGRHRELIERGSPLLPSHEPLTPRETEVLEQMVAGVTTNQALALALGVSENTIKFHVRHILEKFHSHNRAEALAVAVREGLVDPQHE